MIKLENVGKIYAEYGNNCIALKNINLEIKQGEFLAVTGKSGSGKSTLLNIIGCMERVSEGVVSIDGQSVTDFGTNELSSFRNTELGFIFQDYNIEPQYTVYENIEIPLLIAKKDKKYRKERIEKLLEEVGLTDKIKSKCMVLSGGEKQRVAIARALANFPKIILADEPCGNLDSETSKQIMELLLSLNKNEKVTIILVTHNLADTNYAERVIHLLDGAIDGEK